MYASNEHEFQQEHDEWVFLRETPPTTTIISNPVSLLDRQLSSSSSSSSTSTDDSSSESDRSDSLLSFRSNEHEQHPLNDDPVLTNQQTNNTNHELLLTDEIKDEIISSQIMINQTNETETTPIINEYDLSNSGQEIINEPIEPETHLRRRTGANLQQSTQQPSATFDDECFSSSTSTNQQNQHQILFIKLSFIFIFGLLIIFSRIILSQQSTVNQLTDRLEQINQEMNNMKMFSTKNFEQKLTKQFDEHCQNLNQQFTIELQQEKLSLNEQINELNQNFDIIQQNLTNQIHQLINDNHQLQKRFIALKKRSNKINEKKFKFNQSNCHTIDCQTSSMPSIDVLFNHLIKQTSTIAENTSTNLSSLFEQISSSVSNLIDHGQEYVEESKRKFNDFTGSTTAQQVQTTIRRGMENLSSSIRHAQSTYVSWLRTRAEQRERARMNAVNEQVKIERRPWRWTFQRGQDREHMRHHTSTTKKHHFEKLFG